MDINWGQYTELRPGEVYTGKEKAGRVLKEMMKVEKKYIVIIHYGFHWSFTIIDNKSKKLSSYDSGIQKGGSHNKPNEVIKISMESIIGGKWKTEQAQVPEQDEGESCGCRMPCYLQKVVKGQTIQQERVENRHRLYYYLEIAQTLQNNQIKDGKGEREIHQKEEIWRR